jgi:hypothetical protein
LLQYANFNNYDADSKINDFKQDIEEITALASTAQDLRYVRNSINELINTIKTLGLSSSQRGDLKTLLHSALDIVNQRQNEEKEKNKEV